MTEKLILIVSLLFFNYNNEIKEACTKEYTQKLYVQKHMLTLFHIENFYNNLLWSTTKIYGLLNHKNGSQDIIEIVKTLPFDPKIMLNMGQH